MYNELFLIALGWLLLLQVWLLHRRLRKDLQPRHRPIKQRRYPSITVIRPIRGLDAEAEENIRAALATGYPGEVETLFVFDDEEEPALPIVRQVLRERHEAGWPGEARVVLCGQPPAGRTGKLNAMIKGLDSARSELIAFVDSDVRADRLALTVLVDTLLSTPDAGTAFSPVVVSRDHSTVGDAGYALLLNGMYGAAATSATVRNGGGLPFIMGQFMVFKRPTIDAIGGLEAAEGQLVDDMFLGACVSAQGYRNLVSPHPVSIVQRNLGLSDFLATYRRWITFSRSGLPGLSFKLIPALHGVVFWTGLIATAAAVWMGSWAAGLGTLLAPIGVSVSINALHEAVGGAPLRLRHMATSFLLLLSAPLVLLSVHLRPKVNWRGRSYDLDASSRLANKPPSSELLPH
jgi:ceramide glucosyltransferase